MPSLVALLSGTGTLLAPAILGAVVGATAHAVAAPLARRSFSLGLLGHCWTVALAVFAYAQALVALGYGAFFTPSGAEAPALGGLALLASVIGLGIGVPWSYVVAGRRGADAEREPGPPSAAGVGLSEALRVGLRFAAALAITSLLVYTPALARGRTWTEMSAVGQFLLGGTAGLAALGVLAVALRHLGALLTWTAVTAACGIPLLTVVFLATGSAPVEALYLSAVSAVGWAPALGVLLWAAGGAGRGGYRLFGASVVPWRPPARRPPAAEPGRSQPRILFPRDEQPG